MITVYYRIIGIARNADQIMQEEIFVNFNKYVRACSVLLRLTVTANAMIKKENIVKIWLFESTEYLPDPGFKAYLMKTNILWSAK